MNCPVPVYRRPYSFVGKALGGHPLHKILLLLVLVVVQSSAVWAQPVPSEIKSAVGFIFVSFKNQLVPNGTCFFVGVKIPQDKGEYALYIVTAKHVLQNPETHKFFEQVSIRVNTKDGKSEMALIDLFHEGPKKNVFLHSDPTVDLAVIEGGPDSTRHDFKYVPDELLLTKDDVRELNISEGSEVFFTGLFQQHIGQRRNNPIVRFGRVALLTDERVLWDKNQMAELYLIESASYGGNSGSPVYFFLGPERTPGQFRLGRVIKLAGVMQGYFGEVAPVQFIETSTTPIVRNSVGIAAIVPGYKVRDILFSEELKARRGF